MGWELRRQLRSPGRGCWDCCCCSMTEEIGENEGRGWTRKLAIVESGIGSASQRQRRHRFLDSWKLTTLRRSCGSSRGQALTMIRVRVTAYSYWPLTPKCTTWIYNTFLRILTTLFNHNYRSQTCDFPSSNRSHSILNQINLLLNCGIYNQPRIKYSTPVVERFHECSLHK